MAPRVSDEQKRHDGSRAHDGNARLTNGRPTLLVPPLPLVEDQGIHVVVKLEPPRSVGSLKAPQYSPFFVAQLFEHWLELGLLHAHVLGEAAELIRHLRSLTRHQEVEGPCGEIPPPF